MNLSGISLCTISMNTSPVQCMGMMQSEIDLLQRRHRFTHVLFLMGCQVKSTRHRVHLSDAGNVHGALHCVHHPAMTQEVSTTRPRPLTLKQVASSCAKSSGMTAAEVARAVAQEIQIKLTRHDEQRLQPEKRRPVNPQAHELYLRGRHFWYRRTEEGMRKSIECFEEALPTTRVSPRPMTGSPTPTQCLPAVG